MTKISKGATRRVFSFVPMELFKLCTEVDSEQRKSFKGEHRNIVPPVEIKAIQPDTLAESERLSVYSTRYVVDYELVQVEPDTLPAEWKVIIDGIHSNDDPDTNIWDPNENSLVLQRLYVTGKYKRDAKVAIRFRAYKENTFTSIDDHVIVLKRESLHDFYSKPFTVISKRKKRKINQDP